jgi:hypothetical protein
MKRRNLGTKLYEFVSCVRTYRRRLVLRFHGKSATRHRLAMESSILQNGLPQLFQLFNQSVKPVVKKNVSLPNLG